MPVRLLVGRFLLLDGGAFDDLELVGTGVVTIIPQLVGNAGCVLLEGGFAPRA
jgi:hypothetical protein